MDRNNLGNRKRVKAKTNKNIIDITSQVSLEYQSEPKISLKPSGVSKMNIRLIKVNGTGLF